DADGRIVVLPREAGGVGGQLGDGVFVVGLVAVAVLDRGPVRLGDAGLEGQDGVGVGGGILPADHLQHALDIGAVQRLLLGPALFQIVVAVGQAEPRLAGRDDVAGRRLLVGRDAGAEDRAADAALGLAHVDGGLLMGVGGANGGEVGLQRLGVQRLDAGLVHIGAVGGGDLLLVRARRQVGARGQALDHRLDAVVGQFAQQGEGPVAGAVRRNLHGVEGGAVGVAEEAVAGCD